MSLTNSPVDPDAFGDPYSRPISTVSTATSGVDSAWRRRQTIKRGVTRKVKLTNGNFVAEYKVPTPVYSAIEAKYSSTNTTEFSYVIFVGKILPSLFTANSEHFLDTCDTPLRHAIQMILPRQTGGPSVRNYGQDRPIC